MSKAQKIISSNNSIDSDIYLNDNNKFKDEIKKEDTKSFLLEKMMKNAMINKEDDKVINNLFENNDLKTNFPSDLKNLKDNKEIIKENIKGENFKIQNYSTSIKNENLDTNTEKFVNPLTLFYSNMGYIYVDTKEYLELKEFQSKMDLQPELQHSATSIQEEIKEYEKVEERDENSDIREREIEEQIVIEKTIIISNTNNIISETKDDSNDDNVLISSCLKKEDINSIKLSKEEEEKLFLLRNNLIKFKSKHTNIYGTIPVRNII